MAQIDDFYKLIPDFYVYISFIISSSVKYDIPFSSNLIFILSLSVASLVKSINLLNYELHESLYNYLKLLIKLISYVDKSLNISNLSTKHYAFFSLNSYIISLLFLNSISLAFI